MTVYVVMSLPKIPYTHRIYMVLANPTYMCMWIHDKVCVVRYLVSHAVHAVSVMKCW